jgi:hypothetical protein
VGERLARPASGLNGMARNFRELQEKMDPGVRSDNQQRVRDELQRIAPDKLRSSKQVTQADEGPKPT